MSRTPTSQARFELRRMASMVRALLALDDELGELGSIETLVTARRQTLAELDGQQKAKMEELAAMAAKGEEQARQYAADAEQAAGDVMDRAKAEAAMKRKEADALLSQAQQRVAQTQQQIADIESVSGAKLAATEAKREALERAVVTAQANLQGLNDQIIASAKQRDEITSGIEELKRRHGLT